MSRREITDLLTAIQDGRRWMERFTRKRYEAAYGEYCEAFRRLYREAAEDSGEVKALAGMLLDGLAAGWKKQRPWNRSVARLNDKQMLVCYLSPMLLEDPVCAALAEVLRDEWAARWPKDAYQIADVNSLRKGFRLTVLGIPVRDGSGGETDA